MLLPRGVTGIEGRKEGPPSSSDYRAFRQHCYAAARGVGGSVHEVLAPRRPMACNYALALIGFRDTTVAVALNGVFPLLAFAAPPADWQDALDFTDCPELAAQFEQFGAYTLLLAEDLRRPLTREMWRDLAPHEQQRVRYFRPRQVGNVVFNHWD
jgi:hypothetical protein